MEYSSETSETGGRALRPFDELRAKQAQGRRDGGRRQKAAELSSFELRLMWLRVIRSRRFAVISCKR
jgi:hypothetical protein